MLQLRFGFCVGIFSLFAPVQPFPPCTASTSRYDQRFLAYTEGTNQNALAYAGIYNNGGSYTWFIRGLSSGTTFTNYYGNSTAQINTNYMLEFAVHQEASGGGWYRLYVNGVLQVEATGVSNTGWALNYVWAGYCYSDSGSSS